MKNIRRFLLLLSSLALTACDSAPPVVSVDTSPVGSGLAVIGIGIVIAAFIAAANN
jgi:hypothetical protein